VFCRSLAVVLLAVLALALGACGGEAESTPSASVAAAEATVLVTTDCGDEVVLEDTVSAGQSAMRALKRVADVETDDGGKFVTAIEGIEQDEGKQLAWLFYLDGAMAEKGATEIELQAGAVEWWDLHDWTEECQVPPEAR
jgi:hypothetical protein